jgi:hypothetical protein
MHKNTPIDGHILIGTGHPYRASDPPFCANDSDGLPDLLVGNGMLVEIVKVFDDWNGVPGLRAYFVYCHETGHHLHVTHDELTP